MNRRRLCALAAAAAAWVLSAQVLAAQTAEAPAMEVQKSDGFVEVLLPELGWRQAVIGRQVPADSVITSWSGASADVAWADAVITLEQLSHVKVISLSSGLVRLSIESGGIHFSKAKNTALEIEFRGMVIHVENGAPTPGRDSKNPPPPDVSFSDGVLTVRSASVVVDGAQAKPLSVAPGATISLLSAATGPVFDSDR